MNNESVTAIKKANKIDYPTLLNHFRKSIDEVKNELDLSVKIEMNEAKREEFRRSLNHLIGIRGKNKNKKEEPNNSLSNSPGNRLINKKKLDNFRVITEEEDIYN